MIRVHPRDSRATISIMKTKLLLALAFASLLFTSTQAADYAPKVGLQSWTCRNMSFEEVVAFAEKHGLKHLQAIGKHIDPNGSLDDAKKKKAILDAKGISFYTFGVAGTSPDKEVNRKLFVFAKAMGIKVIIVEPKNDKALWDGLEALVKEYDIKLAIHNHGKDSVYGTPEKVWSVLKDRDARIGVCMDVGHITGAGFDAGKEFVGYKGRVYDIHLKDKKVDVIDGKQVITDVMVGTGAANYKGLLAELKKAKWDGVMAIETDNATFAKEPSEFVAGAIKFVKDNAK